MVAAKIHIRPFHARLFSHARVSYWTRIISLAPRHGFDVHGEILRWAMRAGCCAVVFRQTKECLPFPAQTCCEDSSVVKQMTDNHPVAGSSPVRALPFRQ
jgi:hypothetical protein